VFLLALFAQRVYAEDRANSLAQASETVSAPQPATPAAEATSDTMRFVTYPDTLWTYKYIGGDPAGLPLREQITHMRAPTSVKQAWVAALDAHTVPDTIWLMSTDEHPLTLYSVAFGGRMNRVFKIRPQALCKWQDRKTGARHDSTRAFSYPPIDLDGKRYTLVQIEKCTNGAFLIEPVARTERIPEPEIPEEKPAPTTRPSTPYIPHEPGVPADLVVNGTVWLTGEYVDRDGRGDHANGFAGTEMIVRTSYGNHNLGYVFRVGGGAIGQPNAEGQFQAGGAQLRAGIRRPIFKPDAWEACVELGGFADAQQVIWRDEQIVSPARVHWQDRRGTVYDGGGYVRAVGYGPQHVAWDARASTGGKLRSAFEAEATVEPGPLVFRGTIQETRYRDRDVVSDGRSGIVPASTFATREAFLGVQPMSGYRFLVGRKQWKLHSPTGEFIWNGNAAAVDVKLNNSWRLRGDVTRFDDTRELDPRTGKRFTNDHTRVYLGLNYDY
jgi:hypothetical protein